MGYLYRDYCDLTDEKLVEMCKNNDNMAIEILISRYIGFIRIRSNYYFIKGAEKEDLIQEGLIGLLKGIRNYDIKKGSSFKQFAVMCINRNIFTAIRSADRKKYNLDNTSISIYKEVSQDNNKKIIDIFSAVQSCENRIIYNEERELLKKYMFKILSDLELKSLTLYYNGFSYDEIAIKLRKSRKSIDASINRAKIKLRKRLTKNDFLVILAA